ncbi:ankyrin and armadillo repeat-containing protein-like isoform X2 [Acanthaster planci]|uniref:Ankyrin and armadillo repeat-containing protein-like isoform X2 n=1 Tax=Acanthaster planci TaxID=133434 RepID=A0A8B7XG61_ACAPL|nr:ankyrin and armadillo repeat-containing protein-like isoform X2 [Acanthaster planci]
MAAKNLDSSMHGLSIGEDPALMATATANRMAAQFFEKFERFELQEALAQSSYHWFLSAEEHKLQGEAPSGVIMSMQPFADNNCVLLFPYDPTVEPLDYREIHQMLRELVVGIYGLNQVPSLSLEANFDQATTCQLPPAYLDTHLGQLLINVDYMMKGVWHGAYFPRDKRLKFNERWRSSLDVNALGEPQSKKVILTEFTMAGMMDITKDPDFANIYDNMRLFPMSEHDAMADKRLFMQYAEDVSIQLTWRQRTIRQYQNLFLVDAVYEASGRVRLGEERLSRDTFERLQARLHAHVDVVQRHLADKAETRRQMEMIKLASFLVPFLIGMRRRNKVPDIKRLLTPLTADECKTERELPPLMLSPTFRCPNFIPGNRYFHLHGGMTFDIETDPCQAPPGPVVEVYEQIQLEAMDHLAKITDPNQPLHESLHVPVKEIGGKKYYVLSMDFETYYPVSPPQPLWAHSFYDKIAELKPKRLPLTDIQMHEQWKRKYGYHQAIKYKNLQSGLKMSSVRGLVSILQTLARKCPPSRLSKQDEDGYTCMHQAAMHNRPLVIELLLIQRQDIDVRRHHLTNPNASEICGGTTPLHLAARCGSLEAALCLVSNRAGMILADPEGWAAIHHAAFYDHAPIVRMFVRKFIDQVELETWDKLRRTPLLLAASSGALESVKILIDLGANIRKTDTERNTMIHLAALRFHTNVLEFFIEWNHPDVPVWQTLISMLKSKNFQYKDSAVRSLEVLTTSSKQYWKPILEADGIPALVEILKMPQSEMQSLGAAVICNLSEQPEIRTAVASAPGAIPTVVRLLGSPEDDIQARAAIVLADLGAADDVYRTAVSHEGGIPPLVALLDSQLEDVLVEAVNAVRVLCLGHRGNQSLVAQHGGIEPLVEFLQVKSDVLRAASSAALAALTYHHQENQDLVVERNAVQPLVSLIRGRNISVQTKAAAALESLAENNPKCQKAILDLQAPSALIRLLKIWALDVKEQAACSLWALAGHTRPQQKMIAEFIGISGIIDLIVKSEKLQHVGCMAMIALTRASSDNQNRIEQENGILPVVRILRSSKTSERVLHMVIKALGTLCVGVANINNPVTQRKIAEENAISTLVSLFVSTSHDYIRVEIANTLACIILGSKENQALLKEEPQFEMQMLLNLLHSKKKDIRLQAGNALATFAFNNTNQQVAIREAGGLKMATFQRFLDSEDETYQAYGAFQIVVLARVIVDSDQVTLSAEGVTRLVRLLQSPDDDTVILSGTLMASLAHTRAGITDAMITSGSVEILIKHLFSPNAEVRCAAAVALGYLTFNRKATRLLLVATRNTPGLYKRLMGNLDKDGKISRDFTEEFRRAQVVGLPALSLEIHGGPPVVPPPRPREKRRPRTTMGFNCRLPTDQQGKSPAQGLPVSRAVSAPAATQRRMAKSAEAVEGDAGVRVIKRREVGPRGDARRVVLRKPTDDGKIAWSG